MMMSLLLNTLHRVMSLPARRYAVICDAHGHTSVAVLLRLYTELCPYCHCQSQTVTQLYAEHQSHRPFC